MKKVKIMLVSALVIAAVGGALAFKAQKSPGLWCGDSQTSCPTVTPELYTTLGADINHRVIDIFCSTQQNGACTYVTVELP